MKAKAVSGIMLTLLVTSMLTLASNIQPVKSATTIVVPDDYAKIQWAIGNASAGDTIFVRAGTYYENVDVYKSLIIIGAEASVTIVNASHPSDHAFKVSASYVNISRFSITGATWYNRAGIYLDSGANYCKISKNVISSNYVGVRAVESSKNTISGNNITNNVDGIHLHACNNNTVLGNNILANNWIGIALGDSSGNTIFENNITATDNDWWCIGLWYCSDNFIYHNRFRARVLPNMTYTVYSENSVDVWDDGYPSGGNYWSDHVTVDDYSGINQDEPGSDGIVDEPYIINYYNRDNYPLVKPWSPVISATVDIDPDTLNLRSGGKWITAYIQLPEGYNAEDVDATTILLNGTISPVLDPMYEFVTNSSEYLVDYNEDGILERMVKFDKAEVMALLDVGEATLTITGEVDGTPFEGSDSIRVVFPFAGCRHLKR